MHATEIQDHARKLFEARGAAAIAEAAHKAVELENQGEKAQAETWRRIEAALKQMAGPRAT